MERLGNTNIGITLSLCSLLTSLILVKMLGNILLFSLPADLFLFIEHVSDVSFHCAKRRLESFVSKRDDSSRKECCLNCLQMMPAITHLFKA